MGLKCWRRVLFLSLELGDAEWRPIPILQKSLLPNQRRMEQTDYLPQVLAWRNSKHKFNNTHCLFCSLLSFKKQTWLMKPCIFCLFCWELPVRTQSLWIYNVWGLCFKVKKRIRARGSALMHQRCLNFFPFSFAFLCVSKCSRVTVCFYCKKH